MNAFNFRFSLSAKALLALALCLTGCGKNPGAPSGITPLQAQEAAGELGRQFAGTTPFEFTRALLLPVGGGNGAKARAARPARIGMVSDAGQQFSYEIQAYDQAGNPVPWETTNGDLIHRVVVNWNLGWDFSDSSSTTFFRWHDAGMYDVTGLRSADTEWLVSGASNDSLQFHVVDTGTDVAGSSFWSIGEQAVRCSKDVQSSPYPIAGRETIRGDVRTSGVENGQRADESFSADAVLTFNGTAWADLLVDGRYKFQLNLDTGEVRAVAA